tara:strand:+ start:609 stop:833 length:225 start_codon:yes stop_codon:yes gene_type:complete
MTSPQSDVDVNVLVKIYNQRLASLQNQNVLLEAKVQTLLQDHEEEKEMLLANTMELQNKYELLQSKSKSKIDKE